MIRIAVVDDDNEFVKELCIVIKRLLKGKQAEINGFYDPLVFMREAKERFYHIVFIDYAMSVNGFEVINAVNRNGMIWIMVSACVSKAIEGYHYRIFDFIHKPQLPASIEAKLLNAWDKAVKKEQSIEIEWKRHVYRLKYPIINAVYSEGNYTHFVMDKRYYPDYDIVIRRPMKLYIEELLGHGFMKIKCNIYINPQSIIKITDTIVFMKDGTHYELIRRYYKPLKKCLLERS